MAGLLYLLFGLSGAAALVYQVVWVRSLTLVFGGSHLAVTAVLSIFMGGLAIGGRLMGRRVDRVQKPLRLYGLLEIGIAATTVAGAALIAVYPNLYSSLARGRDDAALYLTAVRMLFSIAVLILPTMLMGATLPVMSYVIASQPGRLRRYLGFLYAVNTLGGVAGAVVSGFVLLRVLGVNNTLLVAVVVNAIVGIASLFLQSRPVEVDEPANATQLDDVDETADAGLAKLVLWGIGISGFCALGYEVLWTRVLVLGVSASVYGFTIILAAFLTGIALGSEAYGLVARMLTRAVPSAKRVAGWFGGTQVLIGVTALLVTLYLRDVPVNAVRLKGDAAASFSSTAWTGFFLAFLYIVVPAFFMGAAFPIAGEVLARCRKATGRGVGDTLAANTVGAILGAAVSGLWLIRWLGIERSLEMLALLNIGVGVTVIAGVRRARSWTTAAATATVASAVVLAMSPDAFRLWNRTYFAIFRSNQPEAFKTPELIQEALQNTEVLYYAEGAESIVSVIKVKGGEPAFLTNGRVEASSHSQEQQLQFLLGHLPALLNPDPRQVLVIGLGSGMTAGAAVVQPGVEQVTLVELEPHVRGVAQVFGEFNHHVLDSPKLNFVVNDGRNYLLTTDRTFDVITADPIHPWFKGAGNLYTSEYFSLAARHLRKGGIAAQWLPLYELTPIDIKSIVKTFQASFAHTMLWRTHYDAVLVGSNEPFVIDEGALANRMSSPAIAADLRQVSMGSATDLLSFFVMGTAGMRALSKDAIVNTDDRPSLEFSAPLSIASSKMMALNVDAIGQHRESLLAYVATQPDAARVDQQKRWEGQLAAGRMTDKAASMFLGKNPSSSALAASMRQLSLEYPGYAPAKALWTEYQNTLSLEPRLLEQSTFNFLNPDGKTTAIQISAVLVPISKTRASIMFVDNSARIVYGQAYLDDYEREGRANRFAWDVMVAVQAAYDKDAIAARDQRKEFPAATPGVRNLGAAIELKVRNGQPGS